MIISYFIVPLKRNENRTMTAIMYQKGTGEAVLTTMTLNGAWIHQNKDFGAKTFQGTIMVVSFIIRHRKQKDMTFGIRIKSATYLYL